MNSVPARVDVSTDGASLVVEPVWDGVDRPNTGGWYVRDRKMAARLTAAIMAGKAITARGIRTDVNGQTYVDAQHNVLGRRMNADLRRLGF